MAKDGNGRSHPGRLAFDAELTELIDPLRFFCSRLTGSRDAGNNLAQEALCRALEYRDRFVVRTNLSADLKALLYTIARNAWYTDYRRLKMQRRLSEEKLIGGILANVADKEMWRVEIANDLQYLRFCLDQLPPETQEILNAVYCYGMSYQDAAHTFGCPIGTIKSRINRGCGKLRELMQN